MGDTLWDKILAERDTMSKDEKEKLVDYLCGPAIADNREITRLQAEIEVWRKTCEGKNQAIIQLGKRIAELEVGIKELFLLIDNADPKAWSNGNVSWGMDEGVAMAGEMIDRLRKALLKK